MALIKCISVTALFTTDRKESVKKNVVASKSPEEGDAGGKAEQRRRGTREKRGGAEQEGKGKPAQTQKQTPQSPGMCHSILSTRWWVAGSSVGDCVTRCAPCGWLVLARMAPRGISARGSEVWGLPGDRRERGGGQEVAAGRPESITDHTGDQNISGFAGRAILRGGAPGEVLGKLRLAVPPLTAQCSFACSATRLSQCSLENIDEP